MWRVMFFVIVLAGCRSESAPGAAGVRDSAGVRIVENGVAAWDSASAWHITASPTVTIGDVDGTRAGAQLTWPRHGTRLSDGRIVILESSSNEVHWYAPDGTHLFTRGGNGRGPGEFTSATELLKLPGDTIVVQDAPRIKHVFFSPSGEYVREEPLDFAAYRQHGRWIECLTLTLRDRSLIGCQEESGLQSGWVDRAGLQRSFARFVLVPWSMKERHPLGLHGGIEQWGVADGRGSFRYAVHPFHARTQIAGGGQPPRVAIAVNPQYSIEVWRTDGTLDLHRSAYGRATGSNGGGAAGGTGGNARVFAKR